MANPKLLKMIEKNIVDFNKWRRENFVKRVDLSGANLSGLDLFGANLQKANLSEAILKDVTLITSDLSDADLSGADLSGANLLWTYFHRANLSGVNLRNANLSGGQLITTDLSGADLSNAGLEMAVLVDTKLNGTNLSYSRIYGISAWNLEINEKTKQLNLLITKEGEPVITVDNLEVAQFVYLLLNNDKIRVVIDTIGEKGVLILGRFTPERKAVLDAIRDKVRELGFVPMMFDFEKPEQRDFTETIQTLAGMSRFIIADITNPKSAPLELQAILPHYMIPLVPILQDDEKPFAMFRDLDQKYRQWVLPRLEYDSPENLIKAMDKAIIKRALRLADELQVMKAQERQAEHVKDYL